MASIWAEAPGKAAQKIVGGMKTVDALEVFRLLVQTYPSGFTEAQGCFAWVYETQADMLAKRALLMLHLEFLSPPSKPGPGDNYRRVEA
jgi:hypothetical protein